MAESFFGFLLRIFLTFSRFSTVDKFSSQKSFLSSFRPNFKSGKRKLGDQYVFNRKKRAKCRQLCAFSLFLEQPFSPKSPLCKFQSHFGKNIDVSKTTVFFGF